MFEMIIRIFKKIILYIIYIFGIEIKIIKNIDDIKLQVNILDPGGRCYFLMKSYIEKNNPIYKLIQNKFNSDLVVDIGANYGFTSVIFSKIFNKAKIISIEPVKKLCKYIEVNSKLNNSNIILIRGICGDNSLIDYKYISKNPFYSQDNRVNRPSIFWNKEKVDLVSIDKNLILLNIGFTFIKIDVQGYEYEVMKGGENYLKNYNNWIIKIEFSPFLLQSQGTNPEIFLNYLINNYDVVDISGNLNFKGNIFDLFNYKLTLYDTDLFIKYVKSLNHKELGYIDLLIKSKNLYK